MNDFEKVNVDVTDLNRQQTLRILVLTQGLPEEVAAKAKQVTTVNVMGEEITLPNGSFTLCQLVRRLNKANCHWHACCACCPSKGLWFWHEEWVDETGRKNSRLHSLSKDCSPHDLSAAMKALITIEERKENK